MIPCIRGQEFFSRDLHHCIDHAMGSEYVLVYKVADCFVVATPKNRSSLHLLIILRSINVQVVTYFGCTMLKIVEELTAHGHPNITATHPTTVEITRAVSLTKKGDCIVAVEATKGLTDLSKKFRAACMNDRAIIIVELRTSGMIERITGKGSHLLTLADDKELVLRKSNHVSSRTLMIDADKAACDLRRQFIHKLKSTSTEIHIQLTVYS